MVAGAVRALLAGVVDYAGLFPPAALPLDEAAANYRRYRQSDDAWMLGHFVIPASQLSALAGIVGSDARASWPLSVLVGDDVVDDVATIHAICGSTPALDVRSAELRADSVDRIAAIAAALPARWERYVELPVSSPTLPELMRALAAHELRAKIRTGGVTPESIPSAESVAGFLLHAAGARVPVKATAGLHHPVRGHFPLTYAPDAPTGEMFGFLNVFLAGALIRMGASRTELIAMLSSSDASALVADDAGVRWDRWTVGRAQIESARASLVTSFGSCSFREPVDELAHLLLL